MLPVLFWRTENEKGGNYAASDALKHLCFFNTCSERKKPPNPGFDIYYGYGRVDAQAVGR